VGKKRKKIKKTSKAASKKYNLYLPSQKRNKSCLFDSVDKNQVMRILRIFQHLFPHFLNFYCILFCQE